MELTTLFMEILKLSPFVASLFYFLFKVWNTMQKKDDALMSVMKDHQTSMLTMQEKNIAAQNNSADASRSSAEAIRELKGVIGDFKEQMSDKIDDLKPARNANVRRMPVSPTPQVSA